MSWLQLEVLESSPPKNSDDMIFRGAEIFVNTTAIRCVKKRQDGWLQFAMLDGTTFLACIIMEFQTFPYAFLGRGVSIGDS